MQSTEEKAQTLYAAQEKVYPREVKGRFQNYRSIAVYLLLGLYYAMPWIPYGDRQAVLFDLPARKFHIFFLTFWPQDFFFLTLLLIMAGLALFFFTALAGRVWCGYACPQTVWTEVFIWMERWVEGNRNKQMRLTKMPWNAEKIRKRVLKQVLWVSFALFTGFTFVGFFVPIKELFAQMITLQVHGWSAFWVFFYSLATYGNAGFLREQVCQYMCPYARFQSAMFDKDTLIVAYNGNRGEPRIRGKKRKDKAEQEGNAAGDCIDCGLCVQVCPTGIDIRDGLQSECIACAACIDVCDDVMESVGLPVGLVQYSTESMDQGESKSLFKTIVRVRTIIYAILLSAFFIGFVIALAMRSNFQVDILRDRNSLFRMLDSQTVENVYHIKVMNKGQLAQNYRIDVTGLDSAKARWSRVTGVESGRVEAGEIGDFVALVKLPLDKQKRQSQVIEFVISEVQGEKTETVTEESRFWGPKIEQR